MLKKTYVTRVSRIMQLSIYPRFCAREKGIHLLDWYEQDCRTFLFLGDSVEMVVELVQAKR